MVSKPVRPFSSKDAVVCRAVGKTWAEGTPRAHEALRAIDLDVAPNEFIALLGPSGCGKSTLLYLIAGLEVSSGGGIWSFGDRVEAPSPERSLIFQETSLFPWLSVWQNVSFGLSLQGVAADERRMWRVARWHGSDCRRRWTSGLMNCPAVCVSGWRWRARWRCGRRCC